MNFKHASFATLLTLFVVFGFGTAHAQSTLGLEIRPALVQDNVNPGDSHSFTLKITNISAEERTLYLGVQNIKGVDSGGAPIYANEGETTQFDISTWITLPVPSVTLKAGEARDLRFTAQVPLDATPGSHFGSIFFSADPPKLGVIGAGIGMQVGNVISLRISGDVKEEMRLREFSTEKFIYDSPPITFNTRLENLGNVLLRPNGLVEITDMFGKQVGIVEVNETGASVFPGADREYATVWEYDRFAIGRYQAIMSVVYGEDARRTVSGTTSFWVLPLMPILTILGSLLAFALVLYVSMKLYIRKKLREMGAGRGDSDYYARKYNKSASKLVFVAFAIFVLVITFLVLLFVMFA